MTDLAPLFAFPVVVWTGLVAVALVYWLSVLAGVVHLGEGSEGSLDADLDVGAGAKALGEAHGHGLEADGAEGADGADGADGDGGGEHGLLGLFKVRNVPITVSASLVIFFAWLLSFVTLFVAAKAGHPLGPVPAGLVTLVAAPILALPLARLATRPLAHLVVPRRARGARDLVGAICTVRTGEVTDRFGEATVPDTGAELVLRVRVDGRPLRRGEQAVIVEWDADREEYVVAPLELEDRENRSDR